IRMDDCLPSLYHVASPVLFNYTVLPLLCKTTVRPTCWLESVSESGLTIMVRTLPTDHLLRVGEKGENGLGPCRDADLSLHRVSSAPGHVHRASVLSLLPPV